MQKYLSVILFSLILVNGFSQRSIDSLVQTEKKFANTSLRAGIREAFITFIDTAGIVFDKGNPVNGLQLYTDRGKTSGTLTWEPEYAEISSSGDFGYTTGPWKYYSNSADDDPTAQGHFVTVWHLTNEGKWKFLIDFGIGYDEPRKAMPIKEVRIKNFSSKKDDQRSMIQREKKFIGAYSKEGIKTYGAFLSPQSRLNYKGFLPAITANERRALLDSLPLNINYTVLGAGLSPMKDLGYAYGNASIDGKQDGYLRIWRREKKGWKIAVEVLHFR